MNLHRIGKLNELVKNQIKRRPTIIIEPTPVKPFRVFGDPGDLAIAIDSDEWTVTEDIQEFINKINNTKGLSLEDKIIKLYEKLCIDYTYDDNVLSYIQKYDNDTFFLPDDYGRDVSDEWKEKRKQHNRRNCFEVSRVLAKGISELLKLSKNTQSHDVFIIWDEAVTHYLVGLASDDYFVTLDLDDFNQIKDLTRMKTGLTLDGINVLEEKSGIFESVLNKVNIGRQKNSQESITTEIYNIDKDITEETIQSDDLKFLQYTVQILKDKYNLDSAGIFEYAKEIVDLKIGRTARKTYWKKIEDSKGVGDRYTRCLSIDIEDKTYILDVTQDETSQIIREFSERDNLIPFKEMHRDWNEDPYDGR